MFSCCLKMMEPGEGDRAIDVKKYRHESPGPSKNELARLCAVIESNLAEMKQIVLEINKNKALLETKTDKYRLFRFGCLIFDFYLHAEDCLLHIARTIDKWIPASLDWHTRLLKLMKSPFPEKRPPILSPETASLLEDYLVLYLNFHHQGPNLSSEKIKKMTANIDHLYNLLERDLTALIRLLGPGIP